MLYGVFVVAFLTDCSLLGVKFLFGLFHFCLTVFQLMWSDEPVACRGVCFAVYIIVCTDLFTFPLGLNFHYWQW